MTYLAVAVLSFAAGAALTAAVAVIRHRRFAGEHDTRRVWLEHTDITGVCAQQVNDAAAAHRLARALVHAERIYRTQVGDLLDTIARLQQQHRARTRRVRRSPWQPYGQDLAR